MITMMDLTDYATKAWGPAFNLANIPQTELAPLINAKPDACGNWTDGSWQDLPRAKTEMGENWSERQQTMGVVESMKCKDTVSQHHGCGGGREHQVQGYCERESTSGGSACHLHMLLVYVCLRGLRKHT